MMKVASLWALRKKTQERGIDLKIFSVQYSNISVYFYLQGSLLFLHVVDQVHGTEKYP